MKKILRDIIFIIVTSMMVPFAIIGFLVEIIKDGFHIGRELQIRLMDYLTSKE